VAYAILGGGSSTHAVPQVDGQTLTQAEHEITQAGLGYTVVKQPSATVPKDLVIRTSPANGNVVAAGTTVTIFASSGPKMVQVPNVKHHSLADAESILKSKGFQVQEQTAANSTAPSNTVVRQEPPPGSSAKFGSTVTIFVSPGGSLVPAVVGDNYQVALGKLSNAGFSNINVVNVTNPQLSNGTVVAQNPHAGQRVAPSTQITLTVVKNQASPSPSQSPTATSTPAPSTTPSGH
jgi:serine/threonine-protein kinase